MEESWRKQFQMDDEDEALARALELSRLDYQQSQRASANPPDQRGQSSSSMRLPHINLETTRREGRDYVRNQADDPNVTEEGLKQQVKYVSLGAIPLCLPNNYKWNKHTGKCIKIGEERSSLYVIEEALNQLNTITDPVCVVCISGPARKGKSFVLGEAFSQPNVFRLGHEMDPETMGVWLWIVPEIYKDSNCQEFRVVLLDSEGIGDPSSEDYGDRQIFTLSVLLASLLIYNSAGVPNRHDVEQLKFIVNLSQQIQIRSHPESSNSYKDSAYFRKTFPCFFWLLRDVMLSIPKEYEDITDYLLRKVFQEKVSSSTDQETTVVSSILDFFPVFEAFDLPPPTVDRELLKNINQEKGQLSPQFLRGLEQLKVKLRPILSPKRSFNDGEFVTGEALAALINDYIAALNTPGAVPNVQSAWETFTQTKCFEVKEAAIQLYERRMMSQLDGALPCDSDEIRRVHEMAMVESMKEFETSTVQISAETCKNYLEELMEQMENDLTRWHEENKRLTKGGCQDLLHDLKRKHLDPILQRLTGPMGASVSFDQIEDSFLAIESDFKNLSRGAKDVCAQEFFKFQPELQSEMEKHKAHLKQLKDYNEKLSQERKDRAIKEKEMQRILEENARLLEKTHTKQKEMELLVKKHESDMESLKTQYQKDIKEQEKQIENRIKAEVDLFKEDMDVIAEQNREMKEKMEQMDQDMEEKNHEIRRIKMASSSKYMGVVAIDFGTTYSGFAFSFSDQGGIHTKMNWGENEERRGTPKTPTSILLRPNKDFDSFGYDADDKYVNFKHGEDQQYYYLKHFKMELHKRQDLERNTQLTAANGKNIDAITVFSLSMKYLKDEAVETIRDATGDKFYSAEDFQWVLTVPAIWTAAAKQFMREAAYQAGIASPDKEEQLIIALEPEAGAIFCKERKMQDFLGQTGSDRVSDALVSPGKSYVMMDIGGGTLDVTAHESLADGTIREIYKVTGGANGAIYVDHNFVTLLENLYGQPAIEEFRLRYPKDWLELMNNFEEKKTGERASEGKVTRIRVSQTFLEMAAGTSATAERPHNVEILNGYLCLQPNAMKQLFQPVVSEIVTHMETVLDHPELKSVSCLFMVGGFAKSVILREAIATTFSSRYKILIPVTDPAIAVVQGATMFGQKPTTITSRVMATTYGFGCWKDFDPEVHDPQKKVTAEGREKCKDIFDIIVKENEVAKVGETKHVSLSPIYSDQKSVKVKFYTSTDPDAKYITDSTVGPSIGEVTVDSPDTSKGRDREIELSIFFGGTEIKASALDKTSGNVATVKLDFLSKSEM